MRCDAWEEASVGREKVALAEVCPLIKRVMATEEVVMALSEAWRWMPRLASYVRWWSPGLCSGRPGVCQWRRGLAVLSDAGEELCWWPKVLSVMGGGVASSMLL